MDTKYNEYIITSLPLDTISLLPHRLLGKQSNQDITNSGITGIRTNRFKQSRLETRKMLV